jgi:hypothetical protein
VHAQEMCDGVALELRQKHLWCFNVQNEFPHFTCDSLRK